MVSSSIETYQIDTVLDIVIRERGLDRKLLEQRAMLIWGEIVGHEFALHAQPVMIAGGKLRVTVSDAVWLTELNFRKPRLIEQINRRLEADILQDIVFRVGTIQEDGHRQPTTEPVSRSADHAFTDDVALDESELEFIEQTVADVEDQELQDTLRRIFTEQNKLSKARLQEQ